jgi:aldehyde:ferredoxin oxidoreductase
MMGEFAYAGKILKVDLSSGLTTSVPTAGYAEDYIGGRGMTARIYWDEVSPDVGPFDPENCMIFATGPLAGVRGLAGPRWVIAGKSYGAGPGQFCHCNLGGHWGVRLKLSGYDALVVKGRAEKPSYLFIRDGDAEIKDASFLLGKGAIETREFLKNELGDSVSVVACGPAGENRVPIANLIADADASGAGGFGAVMGSKSLKAIAVAGSGEVKVAHPETLQKIIRHVAGLRKGLTPLDMGLGVAGSKMSKQRCYGCPGGCVRAAYRASNGSEGKFMCQSGLFYQEFASHYYNGPNEVPYYANKLCDEYGLDTAAIQPIIIWLARCFHKGILNDGNTGLLLSKLGSLEFIDGLVRKISTKDGFGEVLGRGALYAAEQMGASAKAQITDYAMKTAYPPHDPRVYITPALLYATEPRPTPSQFSEVLAFLINWLMEANGIIEDAYITSEVIRSIAKRFFRTELAVDFSTYRGKALTAKSIQDREAAKESLVLCSFSWPITHVRHSEDHVGDPALESQVLSAVTGGETDEEGLYHVGERIFNLERAIHAREGHSGRQEDALPDYCFEKPAKPYVFYNPGCLVPGRNGEVISKKGAVLDRDKFEDMKTEYYRLRGWDADTGLQTRTKLNELGLSDIADDLDKRGCLSRTIIKEHKR